MVNSCVWPHVFKKRERQKGKQGDINRQKRNKTVSFDVKICAKNSGLSQVHPESVFVTKGRNPQCGACIV